MEKLVKSLRSSSQLTSEVLTDLGTLLKKNLSHKPSDEHLPRQVEDVLSLLTSRLDEGDNATIIAGNAPLLTAICVLVEQFASVNGILSVATEYLAIEITHKCYEYCLFLLLGVVERSALLKSMLKTLQTSQIKDITFSLGSMISNDTLYFTQVK